MKITTSTNNQTQATSLELFEKLAGSLKKKIKLTDQELRKARNDFSKNWARKP